MRFMMLMIPMLPVQPGCPSFPRNVTVYGLNAAAVKSGVQEKVPVLFRLSVNVAPTGRPIAVSVTWSPFASVAEMLNVRFTPSSVDAVAGAVTTGQILTRLTVMTVVAEPVSAFAAVNTTGYGLPDDAPVAGVQLNVPEVNVGFAENVAPAGSGAAVNDVIASPLASDADTVKVRRTFSFTDWVAGAVTTGA